MEARDSRQAKGPMILKVFSIPSPEKAVQRA
jgi:hypothetical protein